MEKQALINMLTEAQFSDYMLENCWVVIEVYSADNNFVTKKRFKNRVGYALDWVEDNCKKHQKFTLTIK